MRGYLVKILDPFFSILKGHLQLTITAWSCNSILGEMEESEKTLSLSLIPRRRQVMVNFILMC